MSDNGIYRLLAQPWLYSCSQLLLAPGAERTLTKEIKHLLTKLPSAHSILDVGCGPSSWLWRVGLHPVGLDLSPAYAAAFVNRAGSAVSGSAVALPFPDGSFDGVWNFGLLHHLPDAMAYKTVSEMLRVCRKGGYVVIFDAVMPESIWQRPIAYALRYLDRGGFVRREDEFKTILPPVSHPYVSERITYSFNGLEGLMIYTLYT
jgi:SAM-dependent methyltransferase